MKNNKITSNIICFVISLFLLRFGIGGVKFILLSNSLKDLNKDGITLMIGMMGILWLCISIALLIGGIVLTIITIQLAKGQSKLEEDEENVIEDINPKYYNPLVLLECMIYIVWIIIALI